MTDVRDRLISIRTKNDGPEHRWKIKGRDLMIREMAPAAIEKRVRTSNRCFHTHGQKG